MKQLLRIKKVQIGFFVFVLLAIFTTSCEKKKTLIESTWQVTNVKLHANSVWLDDFDIVTLSFIDKDKYVFQASSCVIERVKIKRNNEIEFETFL